MLTNCVCWQHKTLRAVAVSCPPDLAPCRTLCLLYADFHKHMLVRQAVLERLRWWWCFCCAAPPSRSATPLSSPKPTIVQGSSSDFAGAPSNQFVKPGETLTYQGAQLSRLADVFSYSYKASQPYINQAVGYVLWPSIVLAPNASVSLWQGWWAGVGL